MNVQELKAKLEAASTKHTYWNPEEGFFPAQIVNLETIFKLLDEATEGKAEKNIFEKIEEIARQLQNGNEVTVICDTKLTEYPIWFKLGKDVTYLAEGELFYLRIEQDNKVQRPVVKHPWQIFQLVKKAIMGNEAITEILEIHVHDTKGAKKEVK